MCNFRNYSATRNYKNFYQLLKTISDLYGVFFKPNLKKLS